MAGPLQDQQAEDAIDLHSEGWHAPMDGQPVSLEEYWELWYEDEGRYEWNNGILEAKPMPNNEEYNLYVWFVQLLDHYLKTQSGYQMVGLETGFEMNLPDPLSPGSRKTVVRKPDIGIIAPDNPVRMEKEDRTYRGTLDICIECVSDSSKRMVQRDTIIKKGEYLASQVREYYILDPRENPQKSTAAFFHFNKSHFTPITPDANGVIHSVEMPGFRFRKEHLVTRPSMEILVDDPAYGFVMPNLKNLITGQKQVIEDQKNVIAEKNQALAEKADEVARLTAELEAFRRTQREKASE